MAADDSRDPRDPTSAGEDDFASLLEDSFQAVAYREGQTVEGRIVAVNKEVAFVDVGGKGEATIAIEELVDPDGKLDVAVGDLIQAVVVSTAGGLTLSHKLARGAATRQRLLEAFRAELPVEGRVERSVSGGFEVRVGGQRAFCPISQIDSTFTANPAIHVGKLYTFKILEYKEDGRNLILSRRALIEAEESERQEEVRKTIVPGAVLQGRVASVMSYGAFVDLGGGIQGLVHVSEMGWSRVADPKTVVSSGQEVQVKVLRVEPGEKGKIALGLKQLAADPWDSAPDTYAVGQMIEGRVTRVAEFGAFVELEPGIEGLAHVSTFPPTGRRDSWKETVAPGKSVVVQILSFEPERKRIGVAIVDEESVRARGARADAAEGRDPIVAGARLVGQVERHEPYGVFVFLAPGRTGLIPLAETGIDRGGDLRKAFPIGGDVEVLVLEVEPGGRRIRLSRKAVHEAEEKRDAQAYTERSSEEASGSFGSLADKLRAAMKRE
jgi:small subunit ribosomal protein S1